MEQIETLISDRKFDDAYASIWKSVYRNDINGIGEQKNIITKTLIILKNNLNEPGVYAFYVKVQRSFQNILQRPHVNESTYVDGL